MAKFQTLPGFRDHDPKDCALRNHVFDTWRVVARTFGFVEYEGPTLEPTDLYRRKSGDEITSQLFHFTDKGDREVALRPELTPSLARLATARQREFKKPLKWFSIGSFFRYEAPQKGRFREFYQFNCDILGESTVAADAELIALAITVMNKLGFGADRFKIRVSDREIWNDFLLTENVAPDQTSEFLGLIDKLPKEKPDVLDEKLTAIGTSLQRVRDFIDGDHGGGERITKLRNDLEARGMENYLELDLSIVRGLAYYTGVVFEVFDTGRNMRAVAGGGRYDDLCELIGGPSAAMPACGFAMGDAVISNLIEETPYAREVADDARREHLAPEAYVIVADEERRQDALRVLTNLRTAGIRADYAMTPAKMGKQFQNAEALGAKAAVIVGAEFPQVNVKDLARRREITTSVEDVARCVFEITNLDDDELL